MVKNIINKEYLLSNIFINRYIWANCCGTIGIKLFRVVTVTLLCIRWSHTTLSLIIFLQQCSFFFLSLVFIVAVTFYKVWIITCKLSAIYCHNGAAFSLDICTTNPPPPIHLLSEWSNGFIPAAAQGVGGFQSHHLTLPPCINIGC